MAKSARKDTLTLVNKCVMLCLIQGTQFLMSIGSSSKACIEIIKDHKSRIDKCVHLRGFKIFLHAVIKTFHSLEAGS
jgi:hypothetical protein